MLKIKNLLETWWVSVFMVLSLRGHGVADLSANEATLHWHYQYQVEFHHADQCQGVSASDWKIWSFPKAIWHAISQEISLSERQKVTLWGCTDANEPSSPFCTHLFWVDNISHLVLYCVGILYTPSWLIEGYMIPYGYYAPMALHKNTLVC